jgi:hypothetical protein
MRTAAPQIQLQPFTAADAHEAAAVFSLAFADDPIEQMMCVEVSAEQKRGIRAEEYQRGLELPGAHVVKAVDTAAGGKLVGAAGFLGAGGLQWMFPVREGAAEMERHIHDLMTERREKVLQGQWGDVWGKSCCPSHILSMHVLMIHRGVPAVCTPGLPAPENWEGDAAVGANEGG